MITLRPNDFFIKEIITKQGETTKVVSLRNSLAFDANFIAELQEMGVKEYVFDESGKTVDNSDDEE